MKAIDIVDPGPDSLLEFKEVAPPAFAPDEIRVRVHATALNRADLLQRRGMYPPPPGASPFLGLEMAGVVEARGAECEGWAVGDRVMGLLSGGGYAQYVVLHEDMAMRIPEKLSFEQGAAIPEVFLTAYQALYLLGDLREGERMLVHAGASGVGTAAIQMGRYTGTSIFATASAGKHALCRRLGASAAIDYRNEDFVQRIDELTEGKGVDLVVDFIGAPYFARNIDVLHMDGRLVLLALMGGAMAELDLRPLFRKRIHVKASTLRSRSLEYKISLTQAFVDNMLPLFDTGEIEPVIDSVYDWQDAEDAHNRMASNTNAGKIVLRVTD